MKRPAIFVRIITALLALVSTHLFSQQTPEQEIAPYDCEPAAPKGAEGKTP